MNIDNTIQIEVKHCTGRLIADVTFTPCGDSASIQSILSPTTKWDLAQHGGISAEELMRITELCSITPEQYAESINDSPEIIFNPYPAGSEYHRRFADELLHIAKTAGEA